MVSYFSLISANTDNAELEKVLNQYPKEMIDDFYRNGMLKAENYDSSNINFSEKKHDGKTFFISSMPQSETQYANECGGMSSAFVMRFYGKNAAGNDIYNQIKKIY